MAVGEGSIGVEQGFSPGEIKKKSGGRGGGGRGSIVDYYPSGILHLFF